MQAHTLTSFNYTVKDDDDAESENATVILTVIGVNDQPVADNKTPGPITEGSPSNINLSATDPDMDDSIIHYNITSLPQHGTLTDNATGTTLTSGASTSSVVTFTPFDNLSSSFSQATNFTYTATDNSSAANNTSQNATVSMTVVGSNDNPVAIGGSGSIITEDSPDNITLSATDIDIGDSLGYAVSTQPSFGNVTIAGNQLLFTPFDNLSATDNVSDSLIFQVTDSQGAIDTATITLTVQGSNDRPVAYDNSSAGTVVEDSPGNITLSATDIDIGDNLTYTLVSPQLWQCDHHEQPDPVHSI